MYKPSKETMNRESLQDYQWQKLSTLLNNMWLYNNKFYRKKWADKGLETVKQIKTWDDFFKLPYTEKNELVADQKCNPPFGTINTFPRNTYSRIHQTSGTMGQQLNWLDNVESWDWWGECWQYVYGGADITSNDRIFFAFSFGPFIGFWSAFEGARKLGALIISGGGMTSEKRLELISNTLPTVLCCTPSYALYLAEVAKEMMIKLSEMGINKLILAGEPGANISSTRNRLIKAYNCTVYDHYGMTEIGAVGFSCDHSHDTHFIETEFVVEVIDPKTGNHVNPGEIGELVITNLGRLGMPLIRYRTGDLVKLDIAKCKCGRIFARATNGIVGRVDNMVVVRGINVFPTSIEEIINSYNEVLQFQIEVYSKQALDQLRIKIELSEGVNTNNLTTRLHNELRARIGLRIEVEVVKQGTLPRAQMKSKKLIRVSV